MTEEHWKNICELAKDQVDLDAALADLADAAKVADAVTAARLRRLNVGRAQAQATVDAFDAAIAELTP